MLFYYNFRVIFYARYSIAREKPCATRQEQRDSVQGQPCATCGATGQKNNADHKDPLVIQHYRDGKVDTDKMRSLDAVQPQCQNCSNQQGGFLSNLSKSLRRIFGFS